MNRKLPESINEYMKLQLDYFQSVSSTMRQTLANPTIDTAQATEEQELLKRLSDSSLYSDAIHYISKVCNTVVVIISGVGGNGKDTFIQDIAENCYFGSDRRIDVKNISSIDPVKNAADILISAASMDIITISELKYAEIPKGINFGLDKMAKNNKYRDLLHTIKTLWIDTMDGPYQYIINQIIQERTANKNNIIFVHIRESSEITKLQTTLTQFGILSISLMVQGLHSPNEYTNEGDVLTENHTYDYHVINKPNDEQLRKLQANCLVYVCDRYFKTMQNICSNVVAPDLDQD